MVVRGQPRPLAGRLLDVGEGGAFLITDVVVALDPPVRLHFDRAGAACEAVGWVLRTMPHAGGQGTAVEFHRANDPFLSFIRRLVTVEEFARVELLSSVSAVVIEIG